MSQSWIIFDMSWTEAFCSTLQTRLHIPTTPWRGLKIQIWMYLIFLDVGKSARNNPYWLCWRQLLEGHYPFVNIITKTRVKFLCTREPEYLMLLILWILHDSSKNTEMLNLFSEQTSTYLLLTNIFPSRNIQITWIYTVMFCAHFI